MNFSIEHAKKAAMDGDVDTFLKSTECLEAKEQRMVALIRTTREIYKGSIGCDIFGPEDPGDLLRCAFEEAHAIDRGACNEFIASVSATSPVRLLAQKLRDNLEIGGENHYVIVSTVSEFFVAAYELKCMFRMKSTHSS